MSKKELLEEYRKLKLTCDRIFQVVAHDLRSPFSGLLGVTEVLNNNLEDISNDDLRNYISTIYESLKNTYALIENLVEWGRIERQKYDKTIESIPLKLLTDEVIEKIEGWAESKNIDIIMDFNNELILETNSIMLEFVLKNLIRNAVKYSERSGKVYIRYQESAGHPEIMITDNGIGISEENLRKIFKPEISWKMNGTDGESGNGLGLIASNRFAEYFGCRIAVESEEGKGSTFTLILPEHPV